MPFQEASHALVRWIGGYTVRTPIVGVWNEYVTSIKSCLGKSHEVEQLFRGHPGMA